MVEQLERMLDATSCPPPPPETELAPGIAYELFDPFLSYVREQYKGNTVALRVEQTGAAIQVTGSGKQVGRITAQRYVDEYFVEFVPARIESHGMPGPLSFMRLSAWVGKRGIRRSDGNFGVRFMTGEQRY